MDWIKTDNKEFNRQLSFSKRLEFLTRYSDIIRDGWEFYVATGGGVGFTLVPGGEIVNIFNNTGIKLCGREALAKAVRLGGRKVFCFDGFLRKLYEKFGFVEVTRAKWDPMFAPSAWNYDKYGKPDVVWLELPDDF